MSQFRDPYGQPWFEVARLPQDLDLSGISRLLRARRLPHRIAEEGDRQVVWVAQAEDREAVAAMIQAWRRGELETPERPRPESPARHLPSPDVLLRLLPVTCLLLLLSLLGYFVVRTDGYFQIGHWFTIVDIGQFQQATLTDLNFAELWRLWTPMFLHFDLLHIAFNGLFLWLFGARLERTLGTGHFLLFVAVVGLGANLGQLAWESNPRFGGMSGVNYAFIGYIWLRQMFAPHPMLVFPKALIPMLLVMLLLGTIGFMDVFVQQGEVANAAHVSGLLLGVSWGVLHGMRLRGASSGTS